MILVIIDAFTKVAHFIPTVEQASAKLTAELLRTKVIKHHGIPKTMSDRGP